nr:gliding motility-associated C-terminal domain-containing protein [uncultured Fluviicola sp.]
MKPLLILLLLSTIPSLGFAQQWGNCTISQFTNEANDVEINNNQESYTAGYITGETAFDLSTLVPFAQGNGDIYIAKYNPTGSLIWEKTFGGSYSDRAIDLAIGADQNIVITGQFFGTVSFGSITLTSSANSKDIFIVKLDPAGNVLWARKEGGNLAENAYGITVDHQNNVILTGQFQGTAAIGNNNFTSAIDPNTNQPSFDFFVSKYSSNGNPLWSLNGSAEYEDRGLAVAVDNQNNIFFTGQFSKDLTFASNTYANLGYNIGFLCKLNPAGQLQFFNQLKAGMTNAYDLELNSDNEVIVTGDFLGNMNYYDATGIHVIQNGFDKHIFILKTANNGNYQWNYTLGSENDISARSVSMDPHKDIFVTGYFKCDLSQIQDTAGATFNSVGFKDGYLLKVNNSGQHEYIKHFGGKMDDEGHGVAITQNDKPHICGSFTKDLNFAYNTALTSTNTSSHSLLSYSSETTHVYLEGDSTRNSFLVNYVNQNYQTLNYYYVNTTDSLVGYIVSNSPHFLPPDTTHFCVSDFLTYVTLTWEHYGPSYSFLWNTGSDYQTIGITNTGDYWVSVQRDDACSFDIDSIYAISEPIPLQPNLTDNYGINLNQPVPYNNYHFCFPDSLTINYSNLQAGTTLTTYEPDGTGLSGVGPFNIHEGGDYIVVVTNQYCDSVASFTILYDEPIPFDTLQLDIIMNTPVPTGDSITVCLGDEVCFEGIDLITNPQKDWNIDLPHPIHTANWTISGVNYTNEFKLKTCFDPQVSGWYNVELDLIIGYENLCGLDTVHYYKSKPFYIHVNPVPTWSGTISGSNLLCENGSVFIHISNPNPAFSWDGPGIIWNNGIDSIEVNAPGYYTYSGILMDSLTGCYADFSLTHVVDPKIAPAILSIPTDGIICPYDSVLMYLPTTYVSYQWIGPEGDSLSTTNQCYGDDLGFYYCHVLDNDGCYLTSPPYELREYTTPSITITPDEYLCPGETITLQLTYTGTPIFNWNPVNSTQDHITVSAPGVYYVQITQCGFTITDSVEIIDGSFTASISVPDSTLCYQDTVAIIGNPSNLNYEWNDGQVTNGYHPVSDPGTYFAHVTNEFGCIVQTNSVSIGLVPESNPPSIQSQTICPGSNIVLLSNSPYTLNWYSSADTTLITTGNQFSLNNLLNDTTFIIAFQSNECPPAFGSVSVELVDSLGTYTILGDSTLCQDQDGLFSVNTTTETISWHHGNSNLGSSNPISIPFSSLNSDNQLSVQISNQCYSTTVFDSVTILPITHIELENDSITLCYYDTELVGLITPDIDSITWNSNLGTVSNDVLLLNGANNYGLISVSGQDQSGCSTDFAQLVVITSNFNTTIDLNFTNYCLGDSGAIIVSTNADSILWNTPVGMSYSDTLSFIVDAVHAGTYSIEYWDALGCHYEDSLIIPVYNYPNLSILPDSIFCLNDIYTFYFPNDTNTYEWTAYGNNTTIPILSDQNLILTAMSPHGCLSSDTLVVHTVNCDDLLPNIITPNGDGINDYFIIDDAYSQLKNQLIVFNRWGNKVFEASPYRNDWNGERVSDGVYFYLYYPNGMKETTNFREGFLHILGK